MVALLARVASEAAEDSAHHSVLTEAETSGLYVLTSFFFTYNTYSVASQATSVNCCTLAIMEGAIAGSYYIIVIVVYC